MGTYLKLMGNGDVNKKMETYLNLLKKMEMHQCINEYCKGLGKSL